ncbi:DUF4349 domain-containing protein [Actinomadura sp. WMMB 499]|uniref:DUF4349 domain-containing protein n=1 Tax=Actinomadura sp. WMMB 499 TaxID=1219491 RepID=UPI00159E81B6|nr:DUF4349 domain-containing protein [Actinomadura sp. WMMB 499]
MLITLLLAGLLAGCSGGSDTAESAPAQARDEGTRQGGGQAAREQGTGAENREQGGTERGAGGQEGSRGSNAKLPSAGRAVIYTSELRVRADDVEKAAARAKQLTTASGGYVGSESASSGPPPRAEIALRVPADRYAELLARLGSELGEKLALTQETEDVTGEVADVESRVRSAEATLASFRKLLERAESLDEIMKLEDEISERESDLESLQARHKALQDSTAYATLTVTLVGKAEEKKVVEPEEQGGFLGGLKDGWGAFTTLVGGLAVLLGRLLPFLVTLAVLAVPAYLARHRMRARFRAWTSGGGRLAPAVPGAPGAPAPGMAPPGASPPGTSGPPPSNPPSNPPSDLPSGGPESGGSGSGGGTGPRKP